MNAAALDLTLGKGTLAFAFGAVGYEAREKKETVPCLFRVPLYVYSPVAVYQCVWFCLGFSCAANVVPGFSSLLM